MAKSPIKSNKDLQEHDDRGDRDDVQSGHSHHNDHMASHFHGHDCGHAHGNAVGNLKLAFFLNLSFVVIELIGGIYTNSVAILSDAVHDLGDSLSLAMLWYLEKVSKRKSDQRFSYGYHRFSTLGALIIATVLIFSSGFIIVAAVSRLIKPEPTNAEGMFILAIIGVAFNGYAAFRVSKGKSLSERMVMWHLLEDAMGWILILLSSIVIKIWHWYALDAGLAIVLAIWIVYNVLRNLGEVLGVFLQASPTSIKTRDIEEKIVSLDLVLSVHHSHLWTLGGQRHIFTTHVVVEERSTQLQIAELKKQIKSMLKKWDIFEATVEIEALGADCADPIHE